uniref:Cap-specific mRNA (nucleoside-2'-O-)-methyltransferase n=1 Tax=Trypanosoma congolense (strain IL3000) TaxID=1068625 RepID=G0V0B6_TRYCI|nr:conserved hypothetical protein [Trypanosoma congolense IL3000]
MNFPAGRILTDGFPRRTYRPSDSNKLEDLVIKGLHFGQRKLLLSEIEFLTAYLQHRKVSARPLLVVYAGAANGSHLPFLFQLFGAIRFILIDPAPFCGAVREISLDTNGPILELVEGYCTDELCERLLTEHGDVYDIVLVSDIRSGSPAKQTNKENTAMVMRDNEMQRSWCWSLNAKAALLKFHPPYPPCRDTASPHYDATDDTPEIIEYLDGTRLFGVWAPKSSSELRLCVQGPFERGSSAALRQYDCTEHEEQCYFYNTDNRYARDCNAEKDILTRYLLAYPSDRWSGPEALSKEISVFLRFPLFLPLDPSFTENNARWVTLLYSTRDSSSLQLFSKLRCELTYEAMLGLVKEWSSATTIPVGVKIGGIELTADFWKAVVTGDLGEAYSFPTIRWRFSRHFFLGKRGRTLAQQSV